MYLENKLTSDAFDYASDIDFCVVSDGEISSELFASLRSCTHCVWTHCRRSNSEGSYISAVTLGADPFPGFSSEY